MTLCGLPRRKIDGETPTLASAFARLGNMEKFRLRMEGMAGSALSSLQVASLQIEIRRVDLGFSELFIKA